MIGANQVGNIQKYFLKIHVDHSQHHTEYIEVHVP